jgi:nucleoside-diphosphate-sugar epimerase
VKYPVTGGTGFTNSHFVCALLEQGASVRAQDNFSMGKRKNIEGLIQQFGWDQFEVTEGDVRNASLIGEAVRGTAIIYHSEGFVSASQSRDVRGVETRLSLAEGMKETVERVRA